MAFMLSIWSARNDRFTSGRQALGKTRIHSAGHQRLSSSFCRRDPSYTSKGSGLPAEVQIVRRMPTAEEHERVAGSAFYKDGIPTGILERTESHCCTDQAGEVIGTTRIMYDAPGWFSIWDVAVLPEWQGRRIGSAMMDAASEMVRDESPGAFLYLFTFKHGFYERSGFSKESVQMRRV